MYQNISSHDLMKTHYQTGRKGPKGLPPTSQSQPLKDQLIAATPLLSHQL